MSAADKRHVGLLMTEILTALGITDRQIVRAVITFDHGAITVDLTKVVTDAGAPHALYEVTKLLHVTVSERRGQ